MGKVKAAVFPVRLRNAEHVTAVQRRRNGLRLNRRWLGVASSSTVSSNSSHRPRSSKVVMGSPRAGGTSGVTRAHVLHPRRAHHV